MKRFALLIILLLLTGCSNKYLNLPGDNADILHTGKELFLEENYYIAFELLADVTGDAIIDEIHLIGYQNEREREDTISSNYYSNLYLYVIDGSDKAAQAIALKHTEGVFPRLIAEDFNGDGVRDIFISLFTTGVGTASRGLYHIISLKDNEVEILFVDEAMREDLDYNINLEDQYVVELSSKATAKTASFQLEKNISEWLENEKIYEAGKAVNPTTFSVAGFRDLVATDINNDGVFELVGSQYLSIVSPSIGLGFIETTLRYDNVQSKWMVIGLEFVPGW